MKYSIPIFLMFISSCSIFVKKPKMQGAVQFYSEIPEQCGTARGIRQKTIEKITSENQMRSHYGLTFLVRFNDGISPVLYGVLYYQNSSENKYCMAVNDGTFAVFSDSQIDEHRKNIIHEICYPLNDCSDQIPPQSK